ncbi:MAG: GNAT family N-acetyltransferase, partial [Candidatus Thermoplasmatota archaeon]|nr:GNAT family N-acetyltransferase [Candidatus Thermoplasmatota archaeon]
VNSFRYNTFFIGRGLESALAEGIADYTPINLSELPDAIADGIICLDVALIQVSIPDSSGKCSLGVSVDIAKAAVENAELVIAQVNRNMPVTLGDTHISVEHIDYLVQGNAPLIEVPSPGLDPISLTIGRHIANLIRDGMTLHFDRTPISSATTRYLDSKNDLGIHTDIITDDLLRLIRSGAVTNGKKKINKGTTVATIALGSYDLYEAVNENPDIRLYPIDYVNNPFVISKNDNMVSIFTIQEMELSGLARVDTKSVSNIRSFPSSTDFIDGTRRAKNGLVIMALYSTNVDGQQSRIVPESTGQGVYFNRAKVDIVVTEYGSVYLRGLSIRERAIALISIAHPKFRKQLLEEAKQYQYVSKDLFIPINPGCIYPHQYSFRHTFYGRYSPKSGSDPTQSMEARPYSIDEPISTDSHSTELNVFFRPVKPSDARRIQRMFYSLSEETIRMRYHGAVKTLTAEDLQGITNIDYSQDVAIIGLIGPPSNPRIIAEGRYMYNRANRMGEFDIVVTEEVQGRGIGTFLANYLKKIAYSRGLAGVYAEVIVDNAPTMALLSKAWSTAEKHFDSGICIFMLRFPEEDIERPKDSIIVYSGRFNDYSYGEGHPFRPDRAGSTLRLINREGFLKEPWMRVEEPRLIGRERLIESHEPAFIEALEKANSGEWDESLLKFNLGGEDTPVFKNLFDYVLLYTSATLTGVDLIINENANVVFNPLGGFHHASRNWAEGFCYVNDVIVAIDAFLAHGLRVAYIDIDAHHGNGVQSAYYKDDRVLTISLHQSGKTLYPWSGFENEIGEKKGRGYNINIPLPPGTDDESYEMVLDGIVTKAVTRFQPNVVVAVVGADTHKNDPLTDLNLTNNGMVEAIKRIRDYSNQLLMLGGGGYNVKSTSQAWCRMWAAANRKDSMPVYLTVLGGTFMSSEGLEGGGIVDLTYRISGEEKNKILDELDRLISYHEKHTLPVIESIGYCIPVS